MSVLPLSYFTSWLAFGERGLSSEAIVSHLTGVAIGHRAWGNRKDHPLDPDDFRRCQLLRRHHPRVVEMFDEMRTASPQWSRLVDRWDEIHAAIEAEVPGYLDHPGRGSAPIAYRLMKHVLNEAVSS